MQTVALIPERTVHRTPGEASESASLDTTVQLPVFAARSRNRSQNRDTAIWWMAVDQNFPTWLRLKTKQNKKTLL